jgi:hypothetical protein
MRSIVLLLGLATACAGGAREAETPAGGQTFAEAVRLICHVDREAGLSEDDDELTVEETRSEWLTAHIENPDGIELYTLIRAKAPGDAANTLAKAVQKVEISGCPLMDALRAVEDAG